MWGESERAGEERSDERAWIISDNISGTSDSEELLVLSAIFNIIEDALLEQYSNRKTDRAVDWDFDSRKEARCFRRKDFDYQGKGYWQFLVLFGVPGARSWINDQFIVLPSSNSKLFIKTLEENIRPTVLEEYEFETGEKWILTGLLGILGPLGHYAEANRASA